MALTDRDLRNLSNTKQNSFEFHGKPSVHGMLDGQIAIERKSNSQLALYRKKYGKLWKSYMSYDGNQYVDRNLTIKNNLVVGGTADIDGNVQIDGSVTIGVDDTGADFRVYSATTNEGLFYDASEDELGLLLTTKLKFHDIGGGEEMYASGDGVLLLNSGTSLTITTPTLDLTSTTKVDFDSPILDMVTQGTTIELKQQVDALAFDGQSDNILNINALNNRVGIGTAAPSTVLHTLSTAGDNIFTVEAREHAQIILHNNYATHNSASYDSSIKFLSRPASGDGSAAGWLLGQDHGAAQKFKLSFDSGDPTAPAFGTRDYLTVDVSGNVGIGTNAPANLLHVADNIASGFVATFRNDGDNANRHGISIFAGDDDGTTGTTYFASCYDGNGGIVGYLQHASGTFTAADASDVRLKKDIIDTSINGLNCVNDMKVRDFKWKANNGEVVAGFIANELRESFPSAVFGEADAMESWESEYDVDGNVIKEAGERILPLTLSRDMLVPVLVKAVQELSAKVDSLENK